MVPNNFLAVEYRWKERVDDNNVIFEKRESSINHKTKEGDVNTTLLNFTKYKVYEKPTIKKTKSGFTFFINEKDLIGICNHCNRPTIMIIEDLSKKLVAYKEGTKVIPFLKPSGTKVIHKCIAQKRRVFCKFYPLDLPIKPDNGIVMFWDWYFWPKVEQE